MIKRRFYKQEHADKSDGSDSSSSSDSEMEAEAEDESEDDAVAEIKEDGSSPTSSGYKSEDSSANEVGVDSPGPPIDVDVENGNDRNIPGDTRVFGKHGAKIPKTFSDTITENDSITSDVQSCIMKCKSVSKCRICPGVVCLTEETLRAHLNSKRHIRSQKLLDEGRLKSILNDNGEIENQETPAELHARIVAFSQDNKGKKNKGRQRQRKRLRKKSGDALDVGKAKESTKSPAKVDESNVGKGRKSTKTSAKVDESSVGKARESTKPPAKKRRKHKN